MSALVCCGLIAVLRLQLVNSLFTSVPKIDCNDGGFYIRADPYNCSNFYKCDHGNPVLFHCPSGLFFNPAIHVCDWPRNVKCMIQNSGSSHQYIGNNEKPYNQAGQQSSYNNGAQLSIGYNSGQQYSPMNGGSQQYHGQKPDYQNQQSEGYNNDEYDYDSVNSGYDDNTNNAGQGSGGDHNNGDNNEQQMKPGNSGSQQYNGNNENAKPSGGEQHNGYDSNHNQYQNNDQGNNNLQYAVQPVQTMPSDTSVGPSIQSPSGPLERPRPTVDQLTTGNGNPYQDYLNPQQNIDIR